MSRFTISIGPGQQVSSFLFQGASLPEVFKGSAVLTVQGGKKPSVVAFVENSGVYSALPAIPTPPVPQSILALTDGIVIDGTGAGPLRDAVVLINDDHIAAVGPAGEVSTPGRANLPMFTGEESKAIIDAAHRRGVPVSVHVTAGWAVTSGGMSDAVNSDVFPTMRPGVA